MTEDHLAIETFREQRWEQASAASEYLRLGWAWKAMVGEVNLHRGFQVELRDSGSDLLNTEAWENPPCLQPSPRLGNLAKP